VKKETAQQVEAFRQQREAAEKALLNEAEAQQRNNAGAASPTDQGTWATSAKKRRRPKEKDTLVGKLRKMSSTTELDSTAKQVAAASTKEHISELEIETDAPKPPGTKAKMLSPQQPSSAGQESLQKPTSEKTVPQATSSLGLGGYSSDED
jgi:hypothetical protein